MRVFTKIKKGSMQSLTRPSRIVSLLTAIIFLLLGNMGLAAENEEKFSPEQIEFFESKVRPLLAKHCYECHSKKTKNLKGGLRLDGRASAIKGGDSGPAVVFGKPEESLFIEAIRWESVEMPPKAKLPDEQIAVLVKWIEMGAPWPPNDDQPQSDIPEHYEWGKLRKAHWAFRPVRKPALPKIKNTTGAHNEIDRFILARLERAGLQPSPPADPRTLIRRISFDLIGLPPTPAEVDEFVRACDAESSPGGALPQAAVRKVLDRLLASPHYGERWGRHWLDVARYSDGYGGFLDSAGLPAAWRYRDWVVAALNRDLPFDQFVKQQIAGDLMNVDGGATATGFFALGPTYRSDGGDPDSVAQAKSETLDDRIDTLSRGFLGLTVSCARCHAHKFDPIPQRDYYSLAGVFNNTGARETPLVPPEVVKAYNDHQQSIKNLEKQLKQQADAVKKEKREPNDAEQKQGAEWKAELERLKKTAPPKYAFAHALTDGGSADMHVAIRGNLRKPGELAPRSFLRILVGEDPPQFKQGSGRLELAAAVADANNPLTARVFVNRVWLHHFGRGLVRTPSNFGSLGEEPTHPELLDWLAVHLRESGWSVKQLHRTMMLSAAYQMSSRFDERSFNTDGENRLVWRMNSRRLDVEAWRDSLLDVTGELDRAIGGPPSDSLNSRRRTLYFTVSRNGDRFASDTFLRLFDFPIMRATVAKRSTSIVPQQYLFLMNSSFMAERSQALLKRLEQDADDNDQRIQLAYRVLYGRLPSDEELRLGLEFVSPAQQAESNPPTSLWQQYVQVLLSANEFMYVQ